MSLSEVLGMRTSTYLFEKDRISLLPEILEGLKDGEYRVKIGQWIAESF